MGITFFLTTGGHVVRGLELFFLILFGLHTTFAQSSWILRSTNEKKDLVAVYFTSSSKGWIAGDNGYLASTTDGGKSWTPYPLNTTEDINEIYFRNDDHGYLVAGKKLFITSDAGRTWQETRIYRSGEFGSATPEFLSIRYADKKRGFAIGSILRRSGDDDVVVDSLAMRTEDGGDTWQRVTIPAKTELYHIVFHGSSHGWIVGDGGLILVTTDGGVTWNAQLSGTKMPLFNVDFRNDNEGFAVGRSGTILRTVDGGANWEKIETNFNDTFMQVDFADDKNGWIVGYGGSILRSSDRGLTWIRQESNTREKLYGLYMTKKYGWAVGANGVMLEFKK